MSQRRRRRNIVACGKCGTSFDASSLSRCPACNASTEDYEPESVRPAVRGFDRGLEGPDLLRPRQEESETAPPEEFIAAGLVLLAFVLIIAAMAMRSPLMLQGGIALFVVTGIGFGVFKLYQLFTGKRKPRDPDSYEPPSMVEWLVGRGFWDRWGK